MSDNPNPNLEPRQTQVTSHLAGQGAMLSELRLLLPALRPGTTRADARRAILQDNILHRDSLGSRTEVVKKLNARYFPSAAPWAVAHLVRALQATADPQQSSLLAYVMLLWNDALAFRLGCEWLAPRLGGPAIAYTTTDILRELERLGQETPEIASWSESTRTRIARHYLSLLRDCGYASGVTQKVLRRPYVGPEVVLFGVYLILGGGEGPAQVPNHPVFRALGLTLTDVLDALGELNQRGRLRFATQGGVIQLSVPDEECAP